MGEWSCFPKGQPPEPVFAGWHQLQRLPRGAQRALWQLISLAISDAEVEAAQGSLQQFCQRFGVNGANVLAAVRACDILL